VHASGPLKEDTVIGPKIAAVERREARVPVTRRAAPQGADEERSALSALRSPRACEGKGRKAPAPRRTNKGDDETRLHGFGGDAFE